MMRTRLVLTALTLGSSLSSFVAYTLLLKYLGASADLDRLFYAASVPVSLAGITSGVLVYLLPPRFTQISRRVQNAALRFLFVGVMGAVLAAIICALAYAVWCGNGAFIVLSIGFALVAMLSMMSTLLLCVAQARGAYFATGLAPAINAIGLLGGVLVAIPSGTVWWVLLGQLLGGNVSAWWLARSQGFTVVRSSANGSRHREALLAKAALRPLKPHAIAITLGTAAFTLFQPIDAFLCARLGEGAISVMSYAQRVVVAVGTMISLGAYAIAARTARDRLREGGQQAVRQLAIHEVFQVVGFGLVVWLAYVLGGYRILGVVLGSSMMSADDLKRLLNCVQWMLLGVGPMAAVPYLFRVFYSLDIYRKPALLGIIMPPIYGLLAWALLERFDILALAYVYCMVWWLALLLSIVWLNQTSDGSSRLLRT